MARNKGAQGRRVFLIELDSGDDLLKVNVPNRSQRTMVEGTIGALKRAEFVEETVLELEGTEGVLGADLAKEDLVRSGRRRSRAS